MASTITNIRALSGAGVLEDRHPRLPPLQFRRYNLIYGFNGSGKSTLSRLFASLARGECDARLPRACTFEFEFDDGVVRAHPTSLGGLERRMVVFNADFVEDNLLWAAGRANPVFHIGKAQAEKAAELDRKVAALPGAEQGLALASEAWKGREKSFVVFKRERARSVADALRLRTRRYEAPQLSQDHARPDWDAGEALSDDSLDAAIALCRAEQPMAKLRPVEDVGHDPAFVAGARRLLIETPSVRLLDDLTHHPTMLTWVTAGMNYHEDHAVPSCLLCGGDLTQERRMLLKVALDGSLKHFLDDVAATAGTCRELVATFSALRMSLPGVDALSPDLKVDYERRRREVMTGVAALETAFQEVADALGRKRSDPTTPMMQTYDGWDGIDAASRLLSESVAALGAVIVAHNAGVDEFARRHEDAILEVRRHYVTQGRSEYRTHQRDIEKAADARSLAELAVTRLREEIVALRSAIREHGPAAGEMNALIRSYLGHGELTICAVEDGYEIHRHGRPVEGLPSEGEKTAIALCYFLSTTASEGRALKDLIVVVDDPISSLDTKALNYACAMIRNRLAAVAQIFVLTHNQNCMNEFKKAWRRKAEDASDTGAATATLLFLDVAVRRERTTRSTNIVPMSKLIREYDSEYHFLFRHLLAFESASDPEYEYAYMMPNVLRRVLDVFLAFRCPGNSGLAQKMEQLCARHPELDRDRMIALDRLVQVESHSESLDDLLGFSSMTLEESRDANAALLGMMAIVDPQHVKDLRRLCR